MGAYSYCQNEYYKAEEQSGQMKLIRCGQPQNEPTPFELRYGRTCPSCGDFEEFSTEEKVNYILDKMIG